VSFFSALVFSRCCCFLLFTYTRLVFVRELRAVDGWVGVEMLFTLLIFFGVVDLLITRLFIHSLIRLFIHSFIYISSFVLFSFKGIYLLHSIYIDTATVGV
jgi:hypothetical protein